MPEKMGAMMKPKFKFYQIDFKPADPKTKK